MTEYSRAVQPTEPSTRCAGEPRARRARGCGGAPRRLARIGWVVLVSALAAACAGGPTPEQMDQPAFSRPYIVGPPDRLFLSILPDPPIEREVVVRPDGRISVDLVGDIEAAGRTVEEIAREIEEKIGRYKRGARVTVSVVQPLSPSITVLGEVRNPSTFPLERETRLAEAIGQVGGPTIFAARSRIRVIRMQGDRVVVFKANLEKIEDGDYTTNVRLQAGDLVVVPRTVSAAIGYAIQNLFFPFQQLLGLGANVATTVVTGGTRP